MNNNQKQELLEYYKNLLILQYNEKNGTARATIDTIIAEVLGGLVAKQVEEGFNVNTAVGKQLDIIAKYLGLQRYELGYGNLTDEQLRILIKFAILKHYNLSTTAAISESLYAMFGKNITFTDNKNMTFKYIINSNINPVIINILKEKDLLPRPMGVGINTINIDKVFGFNGSGLETFNHGTFYSPQPSNAKTLSINCRIADATVIINNVHTRSKLLETGSGYTWSVSKEGYTTVSGSGTISSNTIIDISDLTIETAVDTATITINGTEQKGIFFQTGDTLNYTYSVSAPGYSTAAGSGSITESKTIQAVLGYALTINAPQGATVMINGNYVSSANLPENSNYTWSVSSEGYLTASGSGTITQNTTLNVYSVSGAYALFNFNNSGNRFAYALENTTISYTADSAGCISYSGTKYITTNTVITMATLTAQITPTPDTISINGTSGNKALFENGTLFSYTINATKTGYQNYTSSGSVNQTTTVTGNMAVNFPSFNANYSNGYAQNNAIVFETTITNETAGNYNFTIKGGGQGSTGTSSSFYGTQYKYGFGRGGIATGKIYLAAGTTIKFQRIGAIKPSDSRFPYGSVGPAGQGIALWIDNDCKLVAGGGGQGSIAHGAQSGSLNYPRYDIHAGGGGYNGGQGNYNGNGLSYDGTAGNNTAQTPATAFGGHGGTKVASYSGYDTQAKGGSGYTASDFTQGSETAKYKVISLTIIGGSNWGDTASGNSANASINFQHE